LDILMIRSTAFGLLLGALIVGGMPYAASKVAWPTAIANWIGSFRPSTEATTENWPICTTMAAMGSEADWGALDPDFKAGKKALVAEDWNGAITSLKLAALRDPWNADIENYIGYAYRRLRQLGPAMGHYQQALALNPRHRSAHEHLGELFLVLGEPDKAREHLEALGRICLLPCDELGDLERLITAYRASATH
jgi:tetratricopeptide (TPR) repeat protein